MRRTVTAVALGCVLVMSAAPVVGQSADDTVFIVKDGDQSPSNGDIAVRLSAETPYDGSRVIVAREDEFADALASGVLQSDAPLLLVPTMGPPSQGMVDRIAELGVSEAVILGGVAAVSEQVEGELADMGLATSRRAGASRFETAIAIAAADAPEADTIMLARAFPAEGSTDRSQAFADTLAAGGVAAQNGWPILLTETHALTAPTRDYIIQAAPSRVLILGGTAAIAEDVATELASLVPQVERVAGDSRAGTAIDLVKHGGADSAADVERIVVVEAQGENAWAGGFAAASHAAAFDAPIVLATGTTLPPETEAFLAPGIGGDPDAGPVMTCVVVPDLCETARVAAGLPPRATSPPVAPISETHDVELTGTEIAAVEFTVARGYVISAEVRDADPDCGITGHIEDSGQNHIQGAPIVDATSAYWYPFQATSDVETWTVNLSCSATSYEGSTTVQLSLVTQSDADVPELQLGEVVEFTRSGPGSFALYRVDLAETEYRMRQTIMVGGATALADVINPDGGPHHRGAFTCASGTCETTLPGRGGSHLLWLGAYGDGGLTVQASIELAQ